MNRNETFFAYFVGYNKGCQLADLAVTSIDVAILAFALLTSDNSLDMGKSSFTKDYTEEQLKQGIKAFHDKGKKVLLSINDNGGKGPVTWTDIDPKAFAANMKIIIDDWGFDGIDLDNEDEFSSQSFVEVVKELRTKLDKEAIISLPAYWRNQGNLFLDQIKDQINYVYTMDYWDGTSGIESYVQSLQGILGNDVVAAGVGTPEACPPDQSTPIDVVKKLVNYEPKAGIMLWAANYSDSEGYIKAINDTSGN
jgi:chitinase